MENELSVFSPKETEIANGIELIQDSGITINVKLILPEDHAHHWKIEEPEGPTSEGCCVGCGKTREFKNWFNDVYSTGTEIRENY